MHENATREYFDFLMRHRKEEVDAAIEEARKIDQKYMAMDENQWRQNPPAIPLARDADESDRVEQVLSMILSGAIRGDIYQRDATGSSWWRIAPTGIKPKDDEDSAGEYWDTHVDMDEVARLIMQK